MVRSYYLGYKKRQIGDLSGTTICFTSLLFLLSARDYVQITDACNTNAFPSTSQPPYLIRDADVRIKT